MNIGLVSVCGGWLVGLFACLRGWVFQFCFGLSNFSILTNKEKKTLKSSWTVGSKNQSTNKKNKYRLSPCIFQSISASFKTLKCRYWYYIMWAASSYYLLESELDDNILLYVICINDILPDWCFISTCKLVWRFPSLHHSCLLVAVLVA